MITGPNMSGKSCYAKQVALIVFLAHIGSFVPAQAATIGLTDRILTRVARQDSQSSLQSTFMADLTQVAAMLRQATSRRDANSIILCICIKFVAASTLETLIPNSQGPALALLLLPVLFCKSHAG